MAVDREHLPEGTGTRSESRLRQELDTFGIHVAVARTGQGEPAGVSRLVDAAAVARSGAAADQVRKQVFDILVRGEALSVALIGADGEDTPILAAACRVLSEAVREASVNPEQLEIVVDGGDIMPQHAAAMRAEILGTGTVHVLADATGAGPQPRVGCRDEFWQQLWRHREDGLLRVAYVSRVMSPCPLLDSESANTVLPRTHTQVPAGSAWQQVRVDIARLQGERGGVDETALWAVLRTCVELGERLHARARWPTAQMRADAWLNRRLAITVDGFGDLVQRQAMDPASFATLEYLACLLQKIRRVLWEQSRAIALRGPPMPAIERTDPRRALPRGARHDDWYERWSNTVAATAIRHRNLLALSPWSVFPSERPAEFRYADLLPVLRFADVCTLQGARGLRHWNATTFRAFHLRACAVLHQRGAAHQIAEGY